MYPMHFLLTMFAVKTVIGSPTSHVARQATRLSNGAAIMQTAESLALPTSTATPNNNDNGIEGINDVDSNITTWAKLWGWEGCSKAQKSAILNGLSEAHTVLGTDGVYNIQNHWNDFATVEYLGSPWFHKQNGRRDTIQQYFNRAYGYQQHWYSRRNTKVFCLGDKVGYCNGEASFIAVERKFDNDGLALGVCERYFRLGTLDGIYKSAQNGDARFDLSAYENRARAWITAIMRIEWIANLTAPLVIYPGNIPGLAESASQVKYMAKNFPVSDSNLRVIRNPSSYAWYALAQWVQQKSGNYAHRPQTPTNLGPAW